MDDSWRFRGFSRPNYTQVPDELFDELLPRLGEAELKALLYIVRRTFGFKREADSISFNQFLKGIQAKDGRVLDHGCGIKNRTNLSRALKGLEEKGVIVCEKAMDERGENQTTVYALRFSVVVPEKHHPGTEEAPGVVPQQDYLGADSAPPVVPPRYPQETVGQTVKQETDVESSNGRPIEIPIEDRIVIDRYVKDFAGELNDQAPIASSSTRAARLYASSGLSLETFLEAMQEARRRTQMHSGSIRAQQSNGFTKPKMGYWFSVLEDILGVKTT